jgi:hypothetical protein
MKELMQGFLSGVGYLLAAQVLHYAPPLIRLAGEGLLLVFFALLVVKIYRRWQRRHPSQLLAPIKEINPRQP